MSKLDPTESTITNKTGITSVPRSTPSHMLQPAVPSIRGTGDTWASLGRAAGVTSASPPRDTPGHRDPGLRIIAVRRNVCNLGLTIFKSQASNVTETEDRHLTMLL